MSETDAKDIGAMVARIDERTLGIVERLDKGDQHYVRRAEFEVYVWLIRFMVVTNVGLLIELVTRRMATP